MNYQDSLSITKINLKRQISEAQKIAKDAVKADNFHCYEEAIILYETAINEIRRILQIVENEKINNHNDNIISDNDFILLQNIHSAYFDRLKFLKINTSNNYTSNLKNIEVVDRNSRYNMRQSNIMQEFGITKNNLELQRIKRIQEYQSNVEYFETMNYNNMQNNGNREDLMQRKTQNMGEMSERIYEDPAYYRDINPPNYNKGNYSSPIRSKPNYYDENNLGGSIVSSPNNNIFNREVKNGIEPIPSNNIFINNINNYDLNEYSMNDIQLARNIGSNRNVVGMSTNNGSNSTINAVTMNNMGMNINSPPSTVTPPNSQYPIRSPDKPYDNNVNTAINHQNQIPLQVQIPKIDPSNKMGGKNSYNLPFQSKIITQTTPTTPTTANVPYGIINEQIALNNKENPPYYSNSLPYSIEYLLFEQPHDVQMPEAIPKKLILRPFWLMRLLSRSMSDGGYLTPRMYVPKQLWYQKGVKYVAIETKYQACINLYQHLQKIENANIENLSELSDILKILEKEIDDIQNMLSKKLKYIDEIVQLGSVISLDKKINMTLLWKYGNELNLMRKIPNLDNDLENRIKHDSAMGGLYSNPAYINEEDYLAGRNELSALKSNPENFMKSPKMNSEFNIGNKIQDSIIEDEIFNPKMTSSYNSISINSNVTSSSKLAHSKSRLSRSMDKFTTKKGEKVGDISGYIEVLISLFNISQFFVNLINEVEASVKNNPKEPLLLQVHNQLANISRFFGRVICTFVLKDFEMLLDRYLYKLRQNVF